MGGALTQQTSTPRVLILSDIPTSVQVGIGLLEALRLGVDGSELLSQKTRLLLLRGLVYSHSGLRSDFGIGKLLRQRM